MSTNGSEIAALRQRIEEINQSWADNNDSFFLCTMAVIIFLMQCGFAFLEAGATLVSFAKIKKPVGIAIIGYWSLGWALAHGPSENQTIGLFTGTSQFFLSGLTEYSKFFFQYVFAATAATIVSGAVAERCEFAAFITYCSVISTFVYPILTHWGWSPQGWMLKGIEGNGIKVSYEDFAGSGVVHLCGGSISFVAAYIMGPRIGRFGDAGEIREIKGHSVPFAALGGFILMFGFLAFNGGSVGSISKPGDGHTVGIAMVNTILCGAWAAMTFLFVHYLINGKWTLLLTINACLTGMVSACAACNKMEPWGAAFTGIGAGLIYLLLCRLMLHWRIDDPLDAFAVHFGGGSWGLLSAPLISLDGIFLSFFQLFHGNPILLAQAVAQLGWQIICAMAIITWSVLWMWPIFNFLKKIGKLRVSEDAEIKGLDIYIHGEAAYPIHAYGHGWEEIESVIIKGKRRSIEEANDDEFKNGVKSGNFKNLSHPHFNKTISNQTSDSSNSSRAIFND